MLVLYGDRPQDFLRTNSAWASSSIGRMQLVQYPWDLSG